MRHKAKTIKGLREGVEKRWVFESGAELEGLENEEYIGIRVIVVGIEYYCEKREGD